MPELNTLRPILESIPADQVRMPDIPIPVALQEAIDLRAALDADDGWDRLLAVGLDPSRVTALPDAIAAARQAQSQWVVLRDGRKPPTQRERERRGITLRRELVAACRWNLRHDPRAGIVLGAITRGSGVADLAQDLQDLAQLITSHRSDFDCDLTFDGPAMAEAARSLASEISGGAAEQRAASDPHEAKRLRDRAFTYLDGLVTDIRVAGRYAFRGEPERLEILRSRYLRRRRQQARRRDDALAVARAPEVPPAA